MRTLGRFAFAVVAVVVVSGCSKGGSQSGPLGGGSASTFPVYSPSTVTVVGKYDDSQEVTTLGSSFFGTGPDEAYPYVGTQELIKTSASLDDLEAWLKQLVQSPPQGLVPSTNTVDRTTDGQNGSPAPNESIAPSPAATTYAVNAPFVDSFKVFGLVPSSFWTKDRGRVVMLIVLDPKQVADHLGATMSIFDEYEKMPALLRGGLDATVKKQAGFSVSDLLNTNTPMGMIVYAARNWKNEDTRAIILVDATRAANPLPTPHNT